jgi:hypothetical protein
VIFSQNLRTTTNDNGPFPKSDSQHLQFVILAFADLGIFCDVPELFAALAVNMRFIFDRTLNI